MYLPESMFFGHLMDFGCTELNYDLRLQVLLILMQSSTFMHMLHVNVHCSIHLRSGLSHITALETHQEYIRSTSRLKCSCMPSGQEYVVYKSMSFLNLSLFYR